MDFALKFLWHSTTQGQQNLILDFISFTLFPKLELMIWFFSACSPDHSVYFVPQRLQGPLALGLSAERTPGEAPGGQEELRARAFPSVPPRSPGSPPPLCARWPSPRNSFLWSLRLSLSVAPSGPGWRQVSPPDNPRMLSILLHFQIPCLHCGQQFFY